MFEIGTFYDFKKPNSKCGAYYHTWMGQKSIKKGKLQQKKTQHPLQPAAKALSFAGCVQKNKQSVSAQPFLNLLQQIHSYSMQYHTEGVQSSVHLLLYKHVSLANSTLAVSHRFHFSAFPQTKTAHEWGSKSYRASWTSFCQRTALRFTVEHGTFWRIHRCRHNSGVTCWQQQQQ